MSTEKAAPYPVTLFVGSDGTVVPASETEQANWSFEKFKRVRTYLDIETGERKLCVSAGLWDVSQLRYRPCREAVEGAARECSEMEKRGPGRAYSIPLSPRDPVMDTETWQRYVEQYGARIGQKGLHALRLVACQGFDFTGAARVAGLQKPEMNGRLTVKRLFRTLRKHMQESAEELEIIVNA